MNTTKLEAPNKSEIDNFADVTRILSTPAFGRVDGINNVSLPKLGSTISIKEEEKIIIAGNYVDAINQDAAAGVLVIIDDKKFVTSYGGDRPDIAKVHNNPKYLKSQFYVEIPKESVGLGIHDLKIRVIASDRSGFYESGTIVKLNIE